MEGDGIMIYGYSRVSTPKQARDGNSLEEQRAQLEAAGAGVIFSDVFTGAKMQRPEFTKLLDAIKAGDTLIVTKLDRFARTAAEGAQTVQDLLSKGVTVNILNMGRVDDSPIGRLLVQVLFSFAEFEREMIRERMQAGRIAAAANGQTMGRPNKYGKAQMDHAMKLLDEGNTFPAVEAMTGISKSTLIRHRRKLKAV